MKTKILYFKFTKKNLENHDRNCKSKKNYANIFNNILNGNKSDKVSECKYDTSDNKSQQPKKNKIKCISKVNNIDIPEVLISSDTNNKKENKNKKENIKKNEKDSLSNKVKNSLKTVNNVKTKEKNSIINEYINKSNIEMTKNIKIDLTNPFGSEKTEIIENISSLNDNYLTQENKSLMSLSSKEKEIKKKKKNNIKKIGESKKINESHIAKKEKLKKNKNKPKFITNNIKNLELSKLETSSLNTNKSNPKTKKRVSLKKKDNKFKKIDNNKKRIPSFEPRNLTHNKNAKKDNQFNYVNKITITNDNINENIKLKNNRKSFNYTLNNDTKSKKLILNNTNSNINININITNINDKNIKKEKDFKFKSKIQKCDTDTNNFNNNITTVNIINNNNNNSNSKKKTNDYRLLFYNHPKKEKYSPYFNKLNSKGIEIQSININLGEETNDEYSKKNLTNDTIQNNIDINSNYFKKKEIEHEKKEAQSEYEHFRDLEDFWSNRSQTSCSCKSGFTVSRKLRSLSRERDKIKLLNKFKKNNEKDIERINDKLLNIVNNFHNNSSIYNLKKNKNRKSLNGMRKNYKINKNKNYNTISAAGDKKMKKKKIK